MTTPTPSKEESWSVNGEEYKYSSLGDLLDENDDLKPGDVVHVGEPSYPSLTEFLDVDDIIEHIGERAGEVGGEYADGYPGPIPAEGKAEMKKFLLEWMEKYCGHPNFFTVPKSREYVLTEADFETVPATPES